MMSKFFLHMVNTGIAAGWIALAVIGLRLILNRAPKWIRCLLWGVVGVRLLIPFSVESRLSLLPSIKTIDPDRFFGRIVVQSGVSALDLPINRYLSTHYYESITVPVGFFDACLDWLGGFWLVGTAVLLLYSVVSYLHLYRKSAVNIRYKENIYFCDYIDTSFVLGLFRPRICLPSDLDEVQTEAVIRHEQVHLRRKDHWWKSLAFLLLSIYWFNPVLWLGFWLFCRDLELACDETVIRKMNVEARKNYSRVLLDCSTRRRKWLVYPISFGEVGVKRRVSSVLQYHKPVFGISLLAMVLCVALSVCFLTDPMPGSRALNLPKTAHSTELMMNSMHDPLRSQTDMEVSKEYTWENEIIVDSCPHADVPHTHKSGIVRNSTHCKVCGLVVYSDGQWNAEMCEIGGLL